MKTASCIIGERARPPDDCGRIPGDEELCAASKHPQHDHWTQWIKGDDPERFHLDDDNLDLSEVRV